MTSVTPKELLKTAQERRRTGDRRRQTFDYPSAFVAQVLTTHDRAQPLEFKPMRNSAVEAYNAGGSISVRRAPAGMAHTRSV